MLRAACDVWLLSSVLRKVGRSLGHRSALRFGSNALHDVPGPLSLTVPDYRAGISPNPSKKPAGAVWGVLLGYGCASGAGKREDCDGGCGSGVGLHATVFLSPDRWR
jgi:hypothetical protein